MIARPALTLSLVAETSQLADHLARAHFLGLDRDGRPAFLITEALVVRLPDQTAQAMADGADRLGMAEARDEPAVHDVEDRSFRLHCGVGGLIDSGRRRLSPQRLRRSSKTHPRNLGEPVNNRPFTRLLGSTRVENLSQSCWTARWRREQFDAIAEAPQFADHLARSHLLRLCADGGSAFLVANALVQNLPDAEIVQCGEPIPFTKSAFLLGKCYQTPAVKEPLPESGNSGKVNPKS